MRERRELPADGGGHLLPHLIERLEFGLGLDQGEEHRELRAPQALQKATEDVVVVEEVLTPLVLLVHKGPLQLGEAGVEHDQKLRTGFGRLDTRDAVDDLQPLLDVELHVQRSEYSSDCILVDNCVRAIEEALRNLEKLIVRDRALSQHKLRDTFVPVVDALVVAGGVARWVASGIAHAKGLISDAATCDTERHHVHLDMLGRHNLFFIGGLLLLLLLFGENSTVDAAILLWHCQPSSMATDGRREEIRSSVGRRGR